MSAVFHSLIGSLVIVASLGVHRAESSPSFPPPSPTSLYVSPLGSHAYPFTDWSTAATNIQDAVDSAIDGDTVVVGDGRYLLDAEIVVTTEITITSLNGPEVTIVDGQGIVRCFNLGNTACVVSGLTITNGASTEDAGGGIICSDKTPIVMNCTITGNRISGWFDRGGGMYQGTAINCVISHNKAEWGGGLASSKVINCTVSDNNANSGGGIYSSSVRDCLIIGNIATYSGGGMLHCGVQNSRIINNRANTGGGMYGGTAINSLFYGNYGGVGGGVYNGKLKNCTICSNSSSQEGGVAFRAGYDIIENCIIWGNHARSHIPNFKGTAKNSCAPNLIQGINGNITSPPMFVDLENGDCRLLATSPCIDAGNNAFTSSDEDLDGNLRIMDGDLDGIATVDMGAYEFQVIQIPEMIIPTINLKSKGRTPVTVITTDDFDAVTVDPASVRFAGASPIHHSLEDVDGDGDTDLKLHFKTADLDIDTVTGEVMLMGQTYDGMLVVGMDTVKVVPERK